MIDRFDETEFFRMLKGHLDEQTSRLIAAAAVAAVAREDVRRIFAASGYTRSQLRSASAKCPGADKTR